MTDEEVYIRHILEAARRIQEYSEDIAYEDFINDPEKQDAIVRRLEVIGEAAKNLSQETRGAYPQIPWQDITGMRDVLIHRYFGVDLDAVWDTVESDIPHLEAALS